MTIVTLTKNIYIMKKIILIAAMALGFVVTAVAQPRAVGIRGGYGLEASYQHTVSETNFIEADLGLYAFNAINVGATYNWMLVQPQWTDRGEWGVYAGPGANLGLGFNGWFNVAVCGQVGLEYSFWFPLQVSVDIRPALGFSTGDKPFYIGGFYPTLGVRYKF